MTLSRLPCAAQSLSFAGMQTRTPVAGLALSLGVLLAVLNGCKREGGAAGSTSSGSSGTPAPASGGAVGSCTIAGGKSCFDYPGSSFTAENVKSSCARIAGVHSASACPTADRVGSCDVMVGTPGAQTVRYYGVGFTADRAKINCSAQSGTFAPN
jgi:hypothetical protein